MLDKLDLVEAVVQDNSKINVRFNILKEPGKVICELKNISKSYGPIEIVKNASALLDRGDRIALIGANGKGKSTLLRIIAGTENHEGERIMGYNLIQSFYAQHQLESLNLENDILQELASFATNKTDGDLRGLLGGFLFQGDDVFKKIKVLSGGEKARVSLAKMVTTGANFLVLDEPTNHLDMQSIDILIDVFNNYAGSFIVVSHDRHFVSQIANKIWWIEDNQIKEYPGTYAEFEPWNQQRLKNKPSANAIKEAVTVHVKPKAENLPHRDTLVKALKKQIDGLDIEIAALKKQIDNNEAEMTKESVYTNAMELKTISQTLGKLKHELLDKEQEYETAFEELMGLE
jgi:ATP-binding cassette subfamily F protein 3